MKLSVARNDVIISRIDFSTEIIGIEDASVSFFIGRTKDCHIFLDDVQISREHAELLYDKSGWKIIKKTRYHLLLVNGVSCQTKDLKNGDLITVGPYNLYVTLEQNEAINENLTNNISSKNISVLEQQTSTVISSDNIDLKEPLSNEIDEISKQEELKEEVVNNSEKTDQLIQDNDALENEAGEFKAEENDFLVTDENGPVMDFASSANAIDNNDMALAVEDEQQTKIESNFATVELEIFSEYSPAQKYILGDEDIYIGRDRNKCQIVLKDPEASHVHAMIKKRAISCLLKDLNSANGTILKGARITSAELSDGDEFVIGSTTLTLRVNSDFIKQEKERLLPVENQEIIEVSESVIAGSDINESSAFDFSENTLSKDNEKKSIIEKIKVDLKDPAKRKRILIGLVVIIAFWFFFFDDQTGTPQGPQEKKTSSKTTEQKENMSSSKKLSAEDEKYAQEHYFLMREYFSSGDYIRAREEAEKVRAIDQNYKEVQTWIAQIKKAEEIIAKKKREEQEEIERRIRQEKVKDYLDKAKAAYDEKKYEYFMEIVGHVKKLDPENTDIDMLKNQMDAWKREQERIALEKAAKEADRNRKIEMLLPGKTSFLKKDWYDAIKQLEKFLAVKDMDEDLVNEGAEMLGKAKEELQAITGPLLGKARSLIEGQDLKGSYEVYMQVLEWDKSNSEAFSAMADIREKIDGKARKVYRDALIAESLSLFDSAKEKFQEVQQIAPSDSEYYKKATDKLRGYWE